MDLSDSSLCKYYYGYTDADLAATYGGPADTDWNGHGTWIGGNIAAAVDGYGINGIAPNVGLVALKISEWCGSCYDSSIIYVPFFKAVDLGLDVVSISFRRLYQQGGARERGHLSTLQGGGEIRE